MTNNTEKSSAPPASLEAAEPVKEVIGTLNRVIDKLEDERDARIPQQETT